MPPDKEMVFPLNDEDSDDSNDSDAKQLFELPTRKVIRPPSSSSSFLKRKIGVRNPCLTYTKNCCGSCFMFILPVFIAVFIVSTILCLAFLLVGVAGMKQEMSVLKIQLKNAHAMEKYVISSKEQVQKEFQEKLNKLDNNKNAFNNLQSAVQFLRKWLQQLNNTIIDLQNSPTFRLTNKLNKVKRDISSLQTGMADTGGDIERLKDNEKKLVKDMVGVLKATRKNKHDIFNITVQLSNLENKPIPSLTTTPKTLVVTLTPDEEMPVNRKELEKVLKELEQKHGSFCKKESAMYIMELDKLRNTTKMMNLTYFNEIQYLKLDLQMVKTNAKTLMPAVIATTENGKNLTLTTKTANIRHSISHTSVTSPSIPVTEGIPPLFRVSNKTRKLEGNVTKDKSVVTQQRAYSTLLPAKSSNKRTSFPTNKSSRTYQLRPTAQNQKLNQLHREKVSPAVLPSLKYTTLSDNLLRLQRGQDDDDGDENENDGNENNGDGAISERTNVDDSNRPDIPADLSHSNNINTLDVRNDKQKSKDRKHMKAPYLEKLLDVLKHRRTSRKYETNFDDANDDISDNRYEMDSNQDKEERELDDMPV